MLGKLLAARTVDRYNPFRFAQFERGEQRDIIRVGGGRDSGRGGDRLHRLPPCWCGSSAYQVRPPSTRIGSFSCGTTRLGLMSGPTYLPNGKTRVALVCMLTP